MTKQEQVIQVTDFFSEIGGTLESKGEDYTGEDVLSVFKKVGYMTNLKPEQICLVMIGIKVARLSTLFDSDSAPNNESVLDSVKDLTSYGVLLDGILKDKLNVDI
jgi:hypothetical protein